MQTILIFTLVLHILSGVFWAGTTFALARTGAYQADQFFRPHACTLFAAHARKVSGTQIPLNYRKFAGHFKGAIQSDIREFESCRPSQQIAFAAAT